MLQANARRDTALRLPRHAGKRRGWGRHLTERTPMLRSKQVRVAVPPCMRLDTPTHSPRIDSQPGSCQTQDCRTRAPLLAAVAAAALLPERSQQQGRKRQMSRRTCRRAAGKPARPPACPPPPIHDECRNRPWKRTCAQRCSAAVRQLLITPAVDCVGDDAAPWAWTTRSSSACMVHLERTTVTGPPTTASPAQKPTTTSSQSAADTLPSTPSLATADLETRGQLHGKHAVPPLQRHQAHSAAAIRQQCQQCGRQLAAELGDGHGGPSPGAGHRGQLPIKARVFGGVPGLA